MGCLLPTAKVLIIHNGRSTQARCFIDTGSQVTLVSEKLVDKLHMKRENYKGILKGSGDQELQRPNGKTQFILQSNIDSDFKIKLDAVIYEKVTSDLPSRKIEEEWTHLRNFRPAMADPEWDVPAPVDIILGADVADLIMEDDRKRGDPGTPTAYGTKLGYIVYGSMHEESKDFDNKEKIERSSNFLFTRGLHENNQRIKKDQHGGQGLYIPPHRRHNRENQNQSWNGNKYQPWKRNYNNNYNRNSYRPQQKNSPPPSSFERYQPTHDNQRWTVPDSPKCLHWPDYLEEMHCCC